MTTTALKPFGGRFLVPGVSLNRRLYTKEMIGKAVARMQERIADPDALPIVMRTHHEAGDDSQLIVGRVVGVQQTPDGSARFEARWYDTGPARNIAALVQPADGGPPGLKSVSIHGYFLGETKNVEVDGQSVITASDLEVNAIDLTATPGVVQALIDAPDAALPSESAPAVTGRIPISETWEVPMPAVVTEEAPVASTVTAETADPIKSKADLRRAIKGATDETARVRIIGRARALSLESQIPRSWNPDGTVKERSGRAQYGEIRECYGDAGQAGFAIDAYNGPLSITMRANLAPGDLRSVAAAAMTAACDALQALDPDWDADIDIADVDSPAETAVAAAPAEVEAADTVPAAGSACPCGCGCHVPADDADSPGCPCACEDCTVCHSAPSAKESAPAAAASAPQTPAPLAAAVPIPTSTEESAVSETAQAAETATPEPTISAPVVTFTGEQFAAFLAAIKPVATETAAPAVAAVVVPETVAAAPVADATPAAAPAVEAAPVVAATALTAESIAAAVDAAMKAQIPGILAAYGMPQRQGYRTAETDHSGKAPSAAEAYDDRANLLLGALGR